MVGTSTCPDAGVLQRFLFGTISDSDAGSVAEHLSHCDSCRSSAITLGSPGTVKDAIHLRSGSSPRPASPDSRTTKSGSSASGSPSELPFLSPAQGPDEIGRLGPYRILKVLGEGGMGIVLQAEDTQLGRPVALKVMRPTVACTEASRTRFLLEARATAAIEHDNIVTIYQVGEDDGVPYLAMQLLQGESLDQRLRRHGKLPVADVLWIGRQVALGLAAAHERGLVHRDVKPSNIWVENGRRRVKVLDFGLARQAGRDVELTKVGMVVGTPAYMAPEQAGSGVIDFRCDLFSLGCVLYRIAGGELPFKGANTLATLRALAVDTPRPLCELSPAVPPALSDLVMSLLSKEPQQRPVSAQAVADALEAIQRAPAPLELSGKLILGSLDSVELEPLESDRPAAMAATPARAVDAAGGSAARRAAATIASSPAHARATTPTPASRPARQGSSAVRKANRSSERPVKPSTAQGSRRPKAAAAELPPPPPDLWDEVSPLPLSSISTKRCRKDHGWMRIALVTGGLSFLASLAVAALIWMR